MQIVTLFTRCLLTIVAIAIAVKATPLEPNHSLLRVQEFEDEHGTVTSHRVPGQWHNPTLFNAAFAETNLLITCLKNAFAHYSDKKYPAAKTLLDKYYAINDHSDRWTHASNFIDYLSTTDEMLILEDEYDEDEEPAFTTRIQIQGQQYYGVAFALKFSNKGAKIASGAHPRLTIRGQAAVILHEAVHALMKENQGDHVRINSAKKCIFLSAREFQALKKEYKDTNRPDLRDQLYTVYWKKKYLPAGIRKMQKYCPMQLIGVPDITVAAGYECYYGHEGDINKPILLW